MHEMQAKPYNILFGEEDLQGERTAGTLQEYYGRSKRYQSDK
jgi:hypothetical protein